MSKYSLSTDGKILADNQTIGSVHGDGEFTVEIELAASALSTIKALIYDRMMEERKKPRIEVFKEENEQAPSLLGPYSREEFASAQPPPPPPQDPKLGDKTPAYMQWLGENFPDEFRKRYKGRKTHLSTGINPHLGHGDVPETHFGKDAAEEWR